MSVLQQDYKVGDKVIMTDFTEGSYHKNWVSAHRTKEAEVLTVYQKSFPAEDLDKDTRPLWRGPFGIQDTYQIWGLTIRFEGEKETYIVSSLGFKKVAP